MKNKLLIIAAFLVGMTAMCWSAHASTAYSTIVSNDTPLLYWNFDESSGDARQIMTTSVPPPADPITNSLVPFDFGDGNVVGRISHADLGDGLKLGNAANFVNLGDNFSGALSISNLSTLGPPYAIEFWVQVQPPIDSGSSRSDYLMGFGAGNFPAVLYDYNSPAGRFGIGMYSTSPFGSISSNSPPIADPNVVDQTWHHVVIAYYGDGVTGVTNWLSVYIDGTNSTVGNLRNYPSGGFNFRTPLTLTQLTVGSSDPNGFSNGFIGREDELAIYDLRSLTNESQVTAKVSQVSSGHFALASAAASPDQKSRNN